METYYIYKGELVGERAVRSEVGYTEFVGLGSIFNLKKSVVVYL